MSNRFPLQEADQSTDWSTFDNSNAGDRRTQDQNQFSDAQPGTNAAPQRTSTGDRQWAPGQLATDPKWLGPYATENFSYSEDKVINLDVNAYGACFDPTGSMRVTQGPQVDEEDQSETGEEYYNYPLKNKDDY